MTGKQILAQVEGAEGGNFMCVKESIFSYFLKQTTGRANIEAIKWEEQLLISSLAIQKLKGKQMSIAYSSKNIYLEAKCIFEAISGYTFIWNIVISGELLNTYLNSAVGINSTIPKLS